MPAPRLCLASRSPRRQELLRQVGVEFAVVDVEVDEGRHPDEAPGDYVERVALDKARAAQRRHPGVLLLAADTAVVVDGEVLGKPRDRADGLAMLARLSGRGHTVMTAVALVGDGRESSRVNVSRVHFRAIDANERAAYWATGEPADKAGGYAIQGRAALFVSQLEGRYSAVMGLPLFETGELLRAAGLPAGWAAQEQERG
ncbi:MAG TPA: Maf family protein [Gammaproteobacteria bacterium]